MKALEPFIVGFGVVFVLCILVLHFFVFPSKPDFDVVGNCVRCGEPCLKYHARFRRAGGASNSGRIVPERKEYAETEEGLLCNTCFGDYLHGRYGGMRPFNITGAPQLDSQVSVKALKSPYIRPTTPSFRERNEWIELVVFLGILGILFSIPMIQDYRIKQKELKEGKKPFHSSSINVYREECAEEIFKAIAAKFCPTKFMQEYLVGIGSTAKSPHNEFYKSSHFKIPPIGCFTGLWLWYCPRNAIVNLGPSYGKTERHFKFPSMELKFQSEVGFLVIDCVRFLQQVATGAVQFVDDYSLSRQAMKSVRHLAARIEIPKGNPEGRRTCIGKSLWTKYSWNVWHFSPSEIQQLSFIQDKQKRIESILSFLTEILSDLSSAIDETKTERRKYSADMRKRFPLSVPKGN